jgi:hypothetical protein
MLQVLIEHRGEMPPRPKGFRPLTIPPLEMLVEDIVHDVHRDAPHLSAVLRAYYCGRGRQSVERLEAAVELVGRKLSRREYYAYHDLGFQRVAGALSALARAA